MNTLQAELDLRPSINIVRHVLLENGTCVVWDKDGAAYNVWFNCASEDKDGFFPAHYMPAYEKPYSRWDRNGNPTNPPTHTTTRYDVDEYGDLCVLADQDHKCPGWKRPSGAFGTP
tara:strand:+ start:282 stop:629 length:348 start_codon:yes stop_codon:yes gene_type:complete